MGSIFVPRTFRHFRYRGLTCRLESMLDAKSCVGVDHVHEIEMYAGRAPYRKVDESSKSRGQKVRQVAFAPGALLRTSTLINNITSLIDRFVR